MFRKRISDEEALALRPTDLPPVEPELRVRPPRPMGWTARAWSHGRIDDRTRELLIHGDCARAWVTSHQEERDGEGPDIRATFAWEHEGGIFHGRFLGAYDGMHLALGFPDFSSWLSRAIRPGGTLTVIFPRGRPGDHLIYGKLELYIRRTLSEVQAEFVQARDGGETIELIDQLSRLMKGPIGPMQGDDRLRYFELVRRISGMQTTRSTTMFEVVDAAIDVIEAGQWDASIVDEMSVICEKYMPGLWAAN